MDILACDFGMRGENFPRAVERSMPHGHVDEWAQGVLGSGLVFRHGSTIIARAPVRPENARRRCGELRSSGLL